ncbi:helix-turn-helix domain-containing protein [Crocosphaera sp. Alani8]|uniref:helix-turn-helix domain-containing protein n=1 Tax=Crocosphaera sp. Alani8 TaxID=3038952 RepID=UPI00313A8411
MKYSLNTEKLANLVRSKRGNRGLRETAKEIGNVSPSTISRVEKGKTPDMDTFLALCEWLQVSPMEFIQDTDEGQDLKTPEAIAIRLRSDKNLDPAVANALVSLVKAAYQDMISEPEYSLKELLAGASSEDFAVEGRAIAWRKPNRPRGEGEYNWGKPMGKEIR